MIVTITLKYIEEHFNLHSDTAGVRIYKHKKNQSTVTVGAAWYCDGYVPVFINGWKKRLNTLEELEAYLKL